MFKLAFLYHVCTHPFLQTLSGTNSLQDGLGWRLEGLDSGKDRSKGLPNRGRDTHINFYIYHVFCLQYRQELKNATLRENKPEMREP